MAFARQQEKTEKSGRGNPLSKAAASYQNSLQRGYEGEWDLLYQGQSLDSVLGEEFVEMCLWFYESVWSRAILRKV